MFSNQGLSDFDLFLNFLLFVFLVFLVVLLILFFFDLIKVHGFFHKFLDANELFEVLVTVRKEVRNVRDGNVEEPDHDIILFLFKEKADINPEKDHDKSDEDGQSKENMGVNEIEICMERIIGKRIVNEIHEVVIDIIEGIRLEPGEGLNHFRVH